MERTAIELLLSVWTENNVKSRLHIVHVADAESLEIIQASKVAGANVTCETTPHNLHFVDTDVPDKSTVHKCKPPIRGEEDRGQLWKALVEDEILDMIASDHAPYAPEDKFIEEGDFMKGKSHEYDIFTL